MSHVSALASEFAARLPEILGLLFYAYGLLLATWAVFLHVERRRPEGRRTSAANFVFNGKIMLFNLAVTPIFRTTIVFRLSPDCDRQGTIAVSGSSHPAIEKAAQLQGVRRVRSSVDSR